MMFYTQMKDEVIHMKNKKKSILTRMAAILMAVFTLSIVMSFTAVTAAAAERTPVTAVSVADEAVPTATVQHNNVAMLSAASHFAPQIQMLGNENPNPNGGGGSLSSQTDGDDQFKQVVEFFVKWIKRVGLLVAFVGGVMFGLAIKNNDAEQKQNGLLTLVAGFVVAALCQAVDMFGII